MNDWARWLRAALAVMCVVCSGCTSGRPSSEAGPSSTTASPTVTTPQSNTATATVEVNGGYRVSESFCAQAPLSGSASYVVRGGRVVLKLSLRGLPEIASVFVNWVNDDQDARSYVVAGFTADATGLS